MPTVDELYAAIEPIQSGLVLAGILLLALILVRLFARSHRVRQKLSLPWSLFSLYVVLFALTALANLYFPVAYAVLHIVGLLVLALAVILAAAVAIFDVFLGRRHILVPTIARDIAIAVVYMIAVFAALSQVGVNVTSLVTTSAVLTAVLGFALQDLLSSVMSGVALQIEQPFKVGDWVKFDEQEGRVLETNWRSTKLETLHHDIVVIPNNVITRSPLINFTVPDPVHRRKLDIGLGYEAPPNRVKQSILTALRSVDGVLSIPKPYILLKGYDDFSIAYRIHFFLDKFSKKDHIEDAVLSRIWYQLKRDGLKVPFPIRDINMREVTAEESARERQEARKQVENALAGVAFLEPLSQIERSQLVDSIDQQTFAAEETIIRQGEEGQSFYIVASGRLAVTTRKGVEVAVLERGDYFGEMSLMTGETRSATVTALEDSELYIVDKTSFERIIQSHGALIDKIGAKLDERRQALSEQDSEASAAIIPPSDSGLVYRIRRFFNMGPN